MQYNMDAVDTEAARLDLSSMGVTVVCVFCRRRPVDPEWRPFCSERCRLQDLARWADGAYRVPGEPVREPEDDPNDNGSS